MSLLYITRSFVFIRYQESDKPHLIGVDYTKEQD